MLRGKVVAELAPTVTPTELGSYMTGVSMNDVDRHAPGVTTEAR
jgi:hypothetical protein